jgi:hypothetical protein
MQNPYLGNSSTAPRAHVALNALRSLNTPQTVPTTTSTYPYDSTGKPQQYLVCIASVESSSKCLLLLLGIAKLEHTTYYASKFKCIHLSSLYVLSN